jgi:hypothetical protein
LIYFGVYPGFLRGGLFCSVFRGSFSNILIRGCLGTSVLHHVYRGIRRSILGRIVRTGTSSEHEAQDHQ